MSKIIHKFFEYRSRPPLETIDYTYLIRLREPDIGYIIDYLIKTSEAHLILNGYFKYKISLTISSSKIQGFSVAYSTVHNYSIIAKRFEKYSQSSNKLIGNNQLITIKVKALINNKKYASDRKKRRAR